MYSYDIDTEQEIAAAAAQKAFIRPSVDDNNFKTPQQIYQEVLQKRALNFLKNLPQKIEELSNPEIASLLKVLLLNGLTIESEEELEYWIALLESQALLRLNRYFMHQQSAQTPKFSTKDLQNLSNLLESVILFHNLKQPPKNSPQYKQWKATLEQYKKMAKQLKNAIELSKQTPKLVSRNNNNTQDALSLLESKMLSAGVERGGTYWNEVMADFHESFDHRAFAENWYADQAKIDAEKNVSQKSDYDKINDLRGIKDENEENIRQMREQRQQEQARILEAKENAKAGFTNPRNQEMAEKSAEQKAQKTGKIWNEEDTHKLKVKIIGGKGR